MRKSRFTEAQIIGMIKEQEAGLPTAELCRKHGLSPATFVSVFRAPPSALCQPVRGVRCRRTGSAFRNVRYECVSQIARG
jgi:hypothetical protein